MINLRQVTAGYGKKDIIKDINISFEKGKITSIIGKNGCGKTTLLKVASGLLKPNKGHVLIDGKDLLSFESKELAKRVSYLPQARNIPQVDVSTLVYHGRFPYLSFPGKLSGNDMAIAQNAMKTAGVLAYCNKNMNELSGGERQKAYIAMVLAQDTEIVFLDEPTTYLDINHQLEIFQLIAKLKQLGKTIIMVIHDISAALHYSDMICFMDNGQIVMHDQPQAIYESGEIERIFNVTCEHLTANNTLESYIFRLSS